MLSIFIKRHSFLFLLYILFLTKVYIIDKFYAVARSHLCIFATEYIICIILESEIEHMRNVTFMAKKLLASPIKKRPSPLPSFPVRRAH